MERLEKLKDFFKSHVFEEIKHPEDVLDLPVESLIGISNIHAEILRKEDISTVKDLASLPLIPEIKEIPKKLLEKWQRKAAMIMHFTAKTQERKIILLGLDNAGKTSILSVLQNKFSKITALLPTRGVSRRTLEILGTSFIAWDFGGQISYRDMYLSRPELFLESDLIVFVIDILDTERYDEALEYLFKIMDVLHDRSEKSPVIIDLHKFDPDIRDNPDFLKKRAALIEKIAAKALEYGFDASFVNTTIYIKETIEMMFSLTVQKIAASSSMLDYLLKEYADRISADALVLISKNNLVLGGFSDSELNQSLLMQTGLMLQTLLGYYTKEGFKEETEYYLHLPTNGFCLKCRKLMEIGNDKVFLWALFGDEKAEFEDIDSFIEELKPIIRLI